MGGQESPMGGQESCEFYRGGETTLVANGWLALSGPTCGCHIHPTIRKQFSVEPT